MYVRCWSSNRNSWVVAWEPGYGETIEYYSRADSKQQAEDDAAYLNGE